MITVPHDVTQARGEIATLWRLVVVSLASALFLWLLWCSYWVIQDFSTPRNNLPFCILLGGVNPPEFFGNIKGTFWFAKIPRDRLVDLFFQWNSRVPASSPELVDPPLELNPAASKSRISSDFHFCTRSPFIFHLNNHVCLDWNISAVIEFWWMPSFEIMKVSFTSVYSIIMLNLPKTAFS
jgi:hypothetical protein